jgi:hypothetical protein
VLENVKSYQKGQIGKKKNERVELYDETYERKQKRQKELSWFQSFIALKRDTELHSIRVCRD